jgi:mercuric ion transport protein
MHTEMQNQTPTPSKKGLIAAIGGTILVALCCFTPILLIVLGAVGLSAFTPYLDYVLLPALTLMIAVTVFAYLRWKKAGVKT